MQMTNLCRGSRQLAAKATSSTELPEQLEALACLTAEKATRTTFLEEEGAQQDGDIQLTDNAPTSTQHFLDCVGM